MSIEAMSHVLNERVGHTTGKLVLLAYANHAHKDGTAAYCSVETVAEYAECDARTVRRHVTVLLDDGRMREGDQRLVLHLPANKRPIVYDVALTEQQRLEWRAARQQAAGRREAAAAAGARGGHQAAQNKRGDNLTPQAPGVTSVQVGGDTGASGGDTGVRETVLEPPLGTTPTTNTSPSADAEVVTEPLLIDIAPDLTDKLPPSRKALAKASLLPAFEVFYETYPRKEGRQGAEKAYLTQARAHGVDVVLAGAKRYAADPNLPERKFIPHPATWLNDGRFLDTDPLPARGGRRQDSNLHVDGRTHGDGGFFQ